MHTLLPLLAMIAASSRAQAFWEFLVKGGIFMIPLGITSLAAVTAIIYKLLALSRRRVIPDSLAAAISKIEDLRAADQVAPVLGDLEKGESTLARLSFIAVKHRNRAQSDIVRAVEASAREETAHLHSGIGVLDVVITVAPLLGLLGTASGLVTIFEGLGETTDHLAIAHGIAEALTTTITGLAIAVPCVVAHGYFTRRIEMMTARLEAILSDLTNSCHKAGPNA